MSELIFNRTILEKYNQILSILIIVSVIVNLLLVITVLGVINRPPMLVYSNEGELKVLKVTNLKMDEAMLQDFTKMIVSQYFNFTATSLSQQIEGISQYLSVKAKQEIMDAYKHSQSVIQKEGISQQFAINKMDITRKSNPFWVEVNGSRTLYVNGNNKTIPVTYILEIKKVKTSESNPYGLLVNDVIQKKDKTS